MPTIHAYWNRMVSSFLFGVLLLALGAYYFQSESVGFSSALDGGALIGGVLLLANGVLNYRHWKRAKED